MAFPRRTAVYPTFPSLNREPSPGITRWRGFFRIPVITMVAVAVLAMLWIGGSVLLHRGDVLPGVHVAGVPVGGLNSAAAVESVDAHTAAIANQPITLTVDGKTWTPLPADLGFTFDTQSSVDAAMAYGRDHHVLDGVLRSSRLSGEPITVPLAVAADPATFDAYFDKIDRERDDAPINATVMIEDGKTWVMPAKSGERVDREAIRAEIAERIVTLQSISIEVSTTLQEPSIPTAEALRVQEVVYEMFENPLVLTHGDESWPLGKVEMASLLEVVPDPNNPGKLVVQARGEAVKSVVDTIADDIDGEVSDAWIQDLGTHSWLVPSQVGRAVDRTALASSIHDAFGQGERTVAVPVTAEVQPDVTTADVMRELGITGMIATGNSVYDGSGEGRAHNVEYASYRIDGTLVPPGGVFSFNDAVGSLFNGEYLDAGSYIDGPNGQSLAGGVCQVSTTVFRAALNAGFPIVEWWPHSYRSPFYELGGWGPGFDASIVQNLNAPELDSDFKFRNPTDAWLLVRSEVSADGELSVEILGADPDYAVHFDEPIVNVVEWATDDVSVTVDHELPNGTVLPDQPAMDGLEVTVVRRVYDANGDTVSTDTFVSSYGSYGAIRRVSPDMESASAVAD